MRLSCSVRSKLIVALGVSYLGVLGIGSVAIFSLSQNLTAAQAVKDVRFPETQHINRLAIDAREMTDQVEKSVANATTAGLRVAETIRDSVRVQVAGLQADPRNREQSAELTEVLQALEETFDAGATRLSMVIDQDFAGIAPATQIYRAAAAGLDSLLHELEGSARSSLEAELDGMVFTSRRTMLTSIIIAGVMLPVLIGVLLILVRSINRPLTQALEFLNKLADQLVNASSGVSTSAHTAREGNVEQSSSLHETRGALEELTQGARQNADTTQEADASMKEAHDAAEKSRLAIDRLTASVSKIQDASSETGRIIKTIDEIAFQTNLLALNAAVEAARAGESGRGFAVVAEEVRRLAKRSSEAARNTGDLVDASQRHAQGGVEATAEAVEVVNSVIRGIEIQADHLGALNEATHREVASIETIHNRVERAERVVEQNTRAVEESNETADKLHELAVSLKMDVIPVVTRIVRGACEIDHQTLKQREETRQEVRPPVDRAA